MNRPVNRSIRLILVVIDTCARDGISHVDNTQREGDVLDEPRFCVVYRNDRHRLED